MMSERPVHITETYSPRGRTVVVAGIPAIEIRADDRSDIVLEMDVCQRVDDLVELALRSTEAIEVRIKYSERIKRARHHQARALQVPPPPRQ